MQVEDTRYYRVKDVAEYFSVSPPTIYRAIESGQLDAVRLGTAVRVPGWAVLAYAEACGQAAYDAVAGSVVPPVRDGGLSPAQADGLACVVCGADFLTSEIPHRPVGRSASGSQVFACHTHPEARRAPCGQDVEDGSQVLERVAGSSAVGDPAEQQGGDRSPDPEPTTLAARIEACRRRATAFQHRTQGGEVAR